MVSIYETQQGRLHECEHICPGTWVDLCAPTEEEVAAVCTQLHELIIRSSRRLDSALNCLVAIITYTSVF